MALEALDEAMDLMYDPDAAAGADGAGQGRPADPLDVFLGSLLPGADVGNVDAYIEEIMGPGAERPQQRPAVDVPAEAAVMEQGALENEAVASDEKDAMTAVSTCLRRTGILPMWAPQQTCLVWSCEPQVL